MAKEETIIPPGDYKVRYHGRYATNTAYEIIDGEHKGRFLYVPNPFVPDIILTVTVEEEVTTIEKNVARFKNKREGNVFSTRPPRQPGGYDFKT